MNRIDWLILCVVGVPFFLWFLYTVWAYVKTY